MKSLIRKGTTSLLTLAAAAFCCATASAEVRLYIPQFTVSDYSPVSVDIMLENDIPVMGYSFNIQLPEGLEIVNGSVSKTDRFNQGQQLSYRNDIFGCVSMQQYSFSGNEGSVGTFQVQATPDFFNGVGMNAESREITLTNIAIATEDLDQKVFIAGPQTSTVTVINNTDPVNLTLSASPLDFLINPGGEQTISVAMDNDATVQGMQMEIVLPDGFTFRTDGGNIFNQTPRMSGGATINPLTSGNVTRVVIADMMNNVMLQPGTGDFMSFTVVAPESFTAEQASISFRNVEASVKFTTREVNDFTLTFTNGLTAYNLALGEISALQQSLAAALDEIASACPDVKDNFTGADIQTQIDDLDSSVDAAYADLTLTESYQSVMAPAAVIADAITALVADAKTAQKAHDDEVAADAAREEAYKNANAVVADLRQQLEEAKATIAADCPDVKDNFLGTEITESLTAMQTAIDKAYEDKTIAAEYDNLVAPQASVKTAIDTLVADAKAAQKAHDDEEAAEAARQEAYKNANAVVAGLEKSLTDALATIATECPDVKGNFKGTEITASIDKMQNAIDKAYANKTIVAEYDNLVAPQTSIETAIATLIADAKEAQKAFEANAALETARLNANAEIATLDEALAAALTEISAECPDVKGNFTGAEIQQRITVLRNAVTAAYDAKTLVEKYSEVMAPAAEIETAIATLVADAKAAQEAHDQQIADEEAARQKAYKNANEVVAGLEKSLADALATIATDAPDVKDYFKGTEITASITSMKSAIEKAYANKTIVAEYDNLVAPQTSIETAIATLIADAKEAQKAFEANAALETARLNANARIAALDEALADALTEIATECPDVKGNYTGTEIQQRITVLRNAVTAAYDAKTLAEKYSEVMAPAEGIETAIAALVADAKEAQKAHEQQLADEEAARQAANKAAYEKDLEEIAALQTRLAEVNATIAEKYPVYDYKDAVQKIADAIDAQKKQAEEAYKEVAEKGNYSNDVDAASIETMIAAMISDAEATQKAHDDAEAEAARQAANKAAYEKDLEEITGLEEELADAEATIADKYPSYDAKDEVKKIKDAIAAQKKQADKALEAVAEKGDYSNDVDAETIREMIAVMLSAAEKSGVVMIFGEELTGEYRIFTLDGKQMACPQQGKVNIIVKSDGTTIKAYIK